MATASDLPFTLTIKTRNFKKSCSALMTTQKLPQAQWPLLHSLEENDAVDVSFLSEDPDARLYLGALDTLNRQTGSTDEPDDPPAYRKPGNFSLYSFCFRDQADEPLRVGLFPVSVCCRNIRYYGLIEVKPKQLTRQEWNAVRDSLEKELTGLAMDIVRRHMGIGDIESSDVSNVSPKMLYDFLVIRKYAPSIPSALSDIAENPRFEIVTQYREVSKDRRHRLDRKSIQRNLSRPATDKLQTIPEKRVNYDIRENRLLKRICQDCDRRLNRFLFLLDHSFQSSPLESSAYTLEWNAGIRRFQNAAGKLRGITSLLKSKEWYSQVSAVTDTSIPHSFFMDARYRIFYEMHKEFKKDSFQAAFDPEYSFAWKKSHELYEMWCYIKLIRLLEKNYQMSPSGWRHIFTENSLFPALKTGTGVDLYSETLRLQVIYNAVLPLRSADTDPQNSPLYIAPSHASYTRDQTPKVHNKPDILIHLYSLKNEIYLGSIILECKYRKVSSFFYSVKHPSAAGTSTGQFLAYFNTARSEYLLGDLGKQFNIRPVEKVIVLTPDVRTDGDEEIRNASNIVLQTLKPSEDDAWGTQLLFELEDTISQLRRKEEVFSRIS